MELAEPPGGVTLAQEELQAAVEELVQSAMSKYGEGVWPSVDWDTQTVTLMSDPLVVDKVSTDFEGKNVATGFDVQVRPAPVTRAAYEESILTLSGTPLADNISSFSLPADADQVQVNVTDLAKMGRNAKTDLKNVAEVPLTFVQADVGIQLSRANHAAPFKGGASMLHGGAICSTGFAVLQGVQGYLLSAGHCDESGSATNWSWTDDVGGTTITGGGSAVQLANGALDSMLIDPASGTEGRIFGGKWNEPSTTARYQLQVNGSSSTFLGARLCNGGANTGEHCQLRVGSSDDVSCSSQGVCHRWVARNDDDLAIVAAGDSGGPVYSDLGGDSVGARGIISEARSAQKTCPASMMNPGNPCFSAFMFIGIVDTLKQWSVSIETIP